MIETKVCRMCGTELNEENWYPGYQRKNNCICKECFLDQQRLWRIKNPDKARAPNAKWQKANPGKNRARSMRAARKRGVRPFNENKDCAQFLGIHIAERILSQVFKDVERMPMNNHGYDVICNKDKRIDIKSACCISRIKNGATYRSWGFKINRNTTADYFLCLAFDNREDLNPLHAWLLPGSKFNHLAAASISPSTLHKWDEYRLDLTKILDCCDTLR